MMQQPPPETWAQELRVFLLANVDKPFLIRDLFRKYELQIPRHKAQRLYTKMHNGKIAKSDFQARFAIFVARLGCLDVQYEPARSTANRITMSTTVTPRGTTCPDCGAMYLRRVDVRARNHHPYCPRKVQKPRARKKEATTA